MSTQKNVNSKLKVFFNQKSFKLNRLAPGFSRSHASKHEFGELMSMCTHTFEVQKNVMILTLNFSQKRP